MGVIVGGWLVGPEGVGVGVGPVGEICVDGLGHTPSKVEGRFLGSEGARADFRDSGGIGRESEGRAVGVVEREGATEVEGA